MGGAGSASYASAQKYAKALYIFTVTYYLPIFKIDLLN